MSIYTEFDFFFLFVKFLLSSAGAYLSKEDLSFLIKEAGLIGSVNPSAKFEGFLFLFDGFVQKHQRI